jgi:N-acetylneuraminate synthase
MFGPDVPASVTIDELGQLVQGIRFIEKMMANPVDKNVLAPQMQPLRDLFTKSIVAVRYLEQGHILTLADMGLKKPGTGLPPAKLQHIVGRRLLRAVSADSMIRESDLDLQ